MPTIQAKDLSKEFPRSPFEELGGFPWLPRLVDKVRALTANTLGEYTPFPCAGDQRFLQTMGLDADALKAVITGGASDEEVAQWVKDHAAADAAAKAATYRQGLFAPVTGEIAGYLAHAKEELGKARPDLDLTSVKNFTDLICLEEGHSVPQA